MDNINRPTIGSKQFAVMILYFDCEHLILKSIDNCAKFVDKIYISYSKVPWTYNKQARDNFTNTSELKILETSPHYHKLEIVEGEWDTEEDQRNACLSRARASGYDYLIVQDADEFYHEQEYQKNLTSILEQPDYSFYTTTWINFWKRLDYVIEFKDPGFGEKNTIYSRCANFAVNLKKNTKFARKRIINHHKDVKHLEGICLHLSYVLSDQQILRKLSTWGHSHQVDIENWYKWKWLAWTPQTKYIFPIISVTANKAVPFEGELPPVLRDFPILPQDYQKLGVWDQMRCFLHDFRDMLIFNYRRFVMIFKS